MANKLKIGLLFGLCLAPLAAQGQSITGPLQAQNNLSEIYLNGGSATALANLGGAPKASPTFTGTVTIPSGAVISGYAPLASPTFTGTVTAPTLSSTSGTITTLNTTTQTGSGSSVYGPVVTSNALLKAYPVTGLSAGYPLWESGYYSPSDIPETLYTLQTSNCTNADNGAQVQSNTSGYCWLLGANNDFDVRWWGAVAGGTDPNYTSGDTGNALAFNNMIAYLARLGSASSYIDGVKASGGGQLYGVNYPITDNAAFSKLEDISLVALSATNYPCATTAVLMSTGSTNRDIDYINIDANNLAVNGFSVQSDGTQQFDNIRTSHWFGSCSSVTTGNVATATTGSNIITLTSSPTSLGLKTGMVIRGTTTVAAGIMDRSVIMDTQTSPNEIFINKNVQSAQASFYLTQSGTVATVTGTNWGQILVGSTLTIPGYTTETVSSYGTASATQGGTGTYNVSVSQTISTNTAGTIALGSQSGFAITADLDPDGIVWGLGGINTGGTYTNLTSFEYNGSEADSSINTDKYGFAGYVASGAVNLNIDHAQFNQAISGLYIDKNSGGLTCANCSNFNANWNYFEINAASIMVAPDTGQVALPNYSSNTPIETFNTDANGTPQIQVSGTTKFNNSTLVNNVPNAMVQVYNNQTNANFQNVVGDFTTIVIPNSIALTSMWGPGTATVAPFDYQNTGWSVKQLAVDNAMTAGTNVIAGNLVETPGTLSNGTKYTTTGGCPNTKVGGATAGSFITSGTSCSGTITMNGATGLTAVSGWACDFEDMTTPADRNNVYETNYSTTGITFSSGAVATGDYIIFKCTGF